VEVRSAAGGGNHGQGSHLPWAGRGAGASTVAELKAKVGKRPIDNSIRPRLAEVRYPGQSSISTAARLCEGGTAMVEPSSHQKLANTDGVSMTH